MDFRKFRRRAVMVLATVSTAAAANPDTLVLHRAEFRFPETRPGEVFEIRKVLIHGAGDTRAAGGTLDGAFAAPEPESAPAPKASGTAAPSRTAVGRDVLGRAVGATGHPARLARIRARHGLPTYASRQSDPARPLSRIPAESKGAASRVAVVSSSPVIRDARDLVRMEADERAALRKRDGSLIPGFARDLEAKGGGDSVDAYVTLVAGNPGFLDKRKASQEEQKAHARRWARLKPIARKEDVLRRYGLAEDARNASNPDAAAFVVRATKAQILGMARDPAIASIEEKKAPGLASVPGAYPAKFIDLVRSAYNPPGDMVHHASFPVATQEMGLPDSSVLRLDPSERPDHYHVYDPYVGGDWQHSGGTYHLLALGTPGASRYHFRNGWYGTYAGSYDSIANYNVRVISQSYHSWWYNPLYADSRFVDRASYLYPYTTFVMPTCNEGHIYVPCNQPYNALSVGNVQHYDRSSYNVDLYVLHNGNVEKAENTPIHGTRTKNPDPVYGSAPDREMPYIVAPGWSPDPYWGHSDSTVPWSLGMGGTSLSAPVLAAVAGNVLSGMSSYAQYPELLRAVLLVTAENVDGGYWDPVSTDARDGAGTVSGANAVKFATAQGPYGTDFDPGPGNWNNPVISAFDRDVFTEDNFNYPGGSHLYYYKAPAQIPSGKHLRVVVTWNSSPGLNYVENEISDLDLYVEANTFWAASTSMNGNIEMVDIDGSDLSANGIYTIEVLPGIHRKATDGPEDVNYAIAWTWVKDHAD